MPRKKTQDEFVNELSVSHPNLKVLGRYSGDKNYVDVCCTIHDYIFSAKPNWLHHGSNCKFCYYDRRGKTLRKPLTKLLEELNNKHGNNYSYPNIDKEYKTNKDKITIICPIHGAFKQTINHHLRGQGCERCNKSHLESAIESFLKQNNIEFIQQYRNYSLLGYKTLDFYLPKYETAIECQGIQHFKEIEYFGGDNEFKNVVRRDTDKYNILSKNNIKIIYITEKRNRKFLSKKLFNGIYDSKTYFIEDIEQGKYNIFTELYE